MVLIVLHLTVKWSKRFTSNDNFITNPLQWSVQIQNCGNKWSGEDTRTPRLGILISENF